MRLIHLSDLHLGKKLNEASLIDDQRHILARALEVIDAEAPDAVLIAGDVYDKPVPPAEAVALLDDFLTNLAARALPVVLISAIASRGVMKTPSRFDIEALMIAAGTFPLAIEVKLIELCTVEGSRQMYSRPR